MFAQHGFILIRVQAKFSQELAHSEPVNIGKNDFSHLSGRRNFIEVDCRLLSWCGRRSSARHIGRVSAVVMMFFLDAASGVRYTTGVGVTTWTADLELAFGAGEGIVACLVFLVACGCICAGAGF